MKRDDRVSDIGKSEGRTGRPPGAHPRHQGVFIRFSHAEWGALKRALAAEHPVARRRPALAAWLRDLAVGHASAVLEVQVTRSGLRSVAEGAPDWKRWKLARAVHRAATRRRKPK